MTVSRLIRLASAALLLVSAAAALAWYAGRHWAPSRERYPVQGLDLSEVDGPVDWKAAKAGGAGFGYIRASEGTGVHDAAFQSNWEGAAAAGVARGAYHVFSLCSEPAEQAANHIAIVPRDPAALPPVLVLDFRPGCTARPPRQDLLGRIETYIRLIEAHSERPVMLQLSKAFEAHYRISSAVDRPLWLIGSYLEPDYGTHPWVMWQANPKREVPGLLSPAGWNVVRPE